MYKLFYKEIKLAIYPLIYLFILLAGLMLIPNYPYAVATLSFLQAIQIIFNLARVNKDLEFTATLPVSRNDTVKSKFICVCFIQLLFLVCSIPFALISSLVINPLGNKTLMSANFAFYGATLIEFSIFNLIFLPLFFKSGYKSGVPWVLAFIGFIVTVAIFEVINFFVPALGSLKPGDFIYQIPVLLMGILVYAGMIFVSYKLSVKNFNKVNL